LLRMAGKLRYVSTWKTALNKAFQKCNRGRLKDEAAPF